MAANLLIKWNIKHNKTLSKRGLHNSGALFKPNFQRKPQQKKTFHRRHNHHREQATVEYVINIVF